jgi:hypothetical protein
MDQPAPPQPRPPGASDVAPAPASLRVVAWRDPLVEAFGIDPRSAYVERFWLPVLGPSATWLLRLLSRALEESPGGLVLGLGATARALGLGGEGRPAALLRAVGRCVRFDMAVYRDAGTLAVRRLIGPLPRRHLARLPTDLQERHHAWRFDDLTGGLPGAESGSLLHRGDEHPDP